MRRVRTAPLSEMNEATQKSEYRLGLLAYERFEIGDVGLRSLRFILVEH